MTGFARGKKGLVAVLAGPSGAGKSSVCAVLAEDELVELSVSHTTRAPRPYERHGVHYHFQSQEEFDALAESGGFVEYARVFGNSYGTPRAPLERAVREGRIALLDIDVDGARQVRDGGLDAVFVFIEPPGEDFLVSRLRGRGEDEASIRLRVARYREERARAEYFDAFVVNRDGALQEAVREVAGAIARRYDEINGRALSDGPAAHDAPRRET